MLWFTRNHSLPRITASDDGLVAVETQPRLLLALTVARITMLGQNRPDLLLEAIPMVLNHHANAKFIYAAEGEMMPYLEKRIGELGIGHAIRFVGHVPRGEFVELMRACDVVAVPSRNEPFGIVVLEAWSAGKPVVATKTGGPDEFIDHDGNGLKVYDNPESIAWGIGTLFTDFEDARWMGRNGRIAVETVFSWDVIADELLTVYHN